MPSALVLLSGGQDSTTALLWALHNYGEAAAVETLTFDYAQRHRCEIEAARTIAHKAGVVNTVLPVDTFEAIGGNALTSKEIEVEAPPDENEDSALPSTFVPGRNLIFVTFAAAYAYGRGIRTIVLGVSQTDYSGYPDCRADTLHALQRTIRLGMEYGITLEMPLMYKTKADTVRMAQQFDALDLLAYTHTCYNGVFPPCNECPACVLRARGFSEAGIEDPLIRRARTTNGHGGSCRHDHGHYGSV